MIRNNRPISMTKAIGYVKGSKDERKEILGFIKIFVGLKPKNAKEKLSKAGCEILSILEEIKKNPEGKGIKIIK